MKQRVLVVFYDAHLGCRREAIWTEPDPAPDAETFNTSGFLGPLVEETSQGPVLVPRVALNKVLYLMALEG